MYKLVVCMTLFYVHKSADSYSSFLTRIVNADKVRNPCGGSKIWAGVGHRDPAGGGSRNFFGIDFASNDMRWTVALCNLDSDGDGRTNGEELGDPNCVWKIGDLPSRTVNITHPGICEPLTSPKCHVANSWLQCLSPATCPELSYSDILNTSYRFPNTRIPVGSKNYYCKMFALPSDRIYDVVGYEAVLDNEMAAHHMILYGCGRMVDFTNDTWSCNMGRAMDGCVDPIALWSLGLGKICYARQFGIRVGNVTSAYKLAILQIHWNNMEAKSDYYDSSGIRIFYTQKLRPNAGTILAVGQYDFFLPPRLKSITISGQCSSACSQQRLNGSIYIVMATVHMHSLGKAGLIEHYRNGKWFSDIFPLQSYSYDSPALIPIEPLVFEPGDSIRVNCTFDTSALRNITIYGEGTLDEMCIGYLIYYPTQEPLVFRECSSTGLMQICNDDDEPICDLQNGLPLALDVFSNCTIGCSPACYKTITAFKQTGCASDTAYQVLPQNYPDLSSTYDLIDLCETKAVGACDLKAAIDICRKIESICSFECLGDCLSRIRALEKTGCLEGFSKVLARKEGGKMLSALIGACTQYVTNFADASSPL